VSTFGCWRTYDPLNDQIPAFLNEGIWENGYEDKYLDIVRSMRPGDRIAIKSSYTQARSAVRAWSYCIGDGNRAIPAITENLNDGNRCGSTGRRWSRFANDFFYTYRGTVWRVLPGEWMADGLIATTFDGTPQTSIASASPYWRERFGWGTRRSARMDEVLRAIADKLLAYRNDHAAPRRHPRDFGARSKA
jgi:5-methylcytosine-specific restriction protein B